MKKLVKIAFILAGIGLVTGLGTYLYVFHKPHRNIEKEKPAFTLDAETFFQEFSTDETTSYEKYGNQVIQVKGSVVDISMDDKQASILLIDEMEGISCAFDSITVSHSRNELEKINVGDEIELKGKCDGYDLIMGVVLTRCVLVE